MKRKRPSPQHLPDNFHSMNFSVNTNKVGGFDRASFTIGRDSIHSSLMSRGLSILFKTASIFTEDQRYLDAPTREDKTRVVESIVRTLQDDAGARFLRKIGKNEYKILNDKEVRNKVTHIMRDMFQEHKKKDVRCSFPSASSFVDRIPQYKKKIHQAASVEV